MRLFLFLSLFVLSCHKSSVPKDVFSATKMENVLYDLVRADEMVDFLTIQDSAYRHFSKRSALYDSIFRLHAITKDDYKRSMLYYQDRPDLLKEILDSLYSRTDTTGKKPPIKAITKPE